jgi:hypothetical protein
MPAPRPAIWTNESHCYRVCSREAYVDRSIVSATFARACIFILCMGAYGQNAPPVDLRSTDPQIWIEPRDPAVAIGASVTLTAYVITKDHPPMKLNDTVWTVSGGLTNGTITPAGVYTAPPVAPDNPPKLTAQSPSFKIKADITVTINAPLCDTDHHSTKDPPSKPMPCVNLSPLTSVVRIGDSVDLSAKAVDLSNATIGWEIAVDDKVVYAKDFGDKDPDLKIIDEKDKSAGKITGTGENVKYTAPDNVPLGKVTVKAVAKLDGAQTNTSATAAVILVAPYASAHCPPTEKEKTILRCKIVPFNRLDGATGTFTIPDPTTGIRSKQPVQDNTPASWVQAVAASKALSTGTILEVDIPQNVNTTNCKNYDWKVVTQTEESPNILIYNPSDIGAGVCSGGKFVTALPVRAIWADVTAFPQQADPQRAAPADPSVFKDCWGNSVPQTISPCDRNGWPPLRAAYKLNWVYTHFGQAGSAQGTISLSPVIGTGQRQLSFDVQADPAYKAGPGWINIPLTFEKSTTQGSNLDSLIVGLAYDVRALRNPNLTRSSHFIVRKPQFQIRSGVEVAPTTPHDKNWVESGTIKLPFVFNFHQQPSAFTAYPVIGVEGGSHFDTHLAEDNPILRGVAGVDGSFRWPFSALHNFLGTSPITLEYSYRMRWLAYEEPMTDVSNNGMEMLAAGRRSFLKGSLIAPLTPNIQFTVTALRGSLPPDFRVLGNTVVIGLTFTNPGSSEH